MGLITIDVSAAENQPPTSGWISLVLDYNQNYVFILDDFLNTNPSYNDPEGDPIESVKIVNLPITGVLKKAGVDVVENDIITSAEILNGDLSYQADPSETEGYSDSKTAFVVSDTGSSSFSTSPKQIFISVLYDQASDNLPPSIVGNGETEGDVGFTFTFTRNSLTSDLNPSYSDPENNPAYKLLIESLPTSGSLTFQGSEVFIGQEILFTDIDNGDLLYINKFYPSNGQDKFTFKVSDTISQQYTG